MKKHKDDEDVVSSSGTFTWFIDNFSKLKNCKNYYSQVFFIGGFKWRILVRPNGSYDPNTNVVDLFSIYLGVADALTLPPGWSRYAHFSLTLLNQLDPNRSITKQTNGTAKEFKENYSEWGFKSFMPLCELYDSSKGYLVDDKCIVKAKVEVPIKIGDKESTVSATTESLKKQHEGQTPSYMNSVPAGDSSPAPKTPSSELVPPLQDTPGSEKACCEHTNAIISNASLVWKLEEVPTKRTSELIEFRGLVHIEKAFVPLLEDVCSLHPSLIQILHKRKRDVIQCAFTALGELLYFLKTTKAKDMTEDACVRLQNLWEDLQMFTFDLAWLEPCVQSALGMKRFLERERRVKRLRQDVEVLDKERKRRRDALAVTEAELQVAKRDLEKEEEVFVEIDMDSELGCWRR